jgi:hypothetical protein
MFSRRPWVGPLLALLVLMPWGVEAQQEEVASRLRGGAGYFMVGGAWPGLGALSDRMVAAGYSEPGRSFFVTGGGGHAIIGRLLLGGEGYALSRQDKISRRDDLRAEISGAYGLFRVGYAVLHLENLSVYALGGLGGAGIGLNIDREEDVSFDDVLADPARQSALSNGGLLLDVSAELQYRLPLGRSATGESGFLLLGLRGGYSFVPLRGDWDSRQGDVRGGPDLGLSGPSVRLLVGFGGQGFTP